MSQKQKKSIQKNMCDKYAHEGNYNYTKQKKKRIKNVAIEVI